VRGVDRRFWKTITRSFAEYWDGKVREDGTDGAHGTHGRDVKCIQNFCWKT